MIIAMEESSGTSIIEHGLPAWEDLSFTQRFWFVLGVDSVAGDNTSAQQSYDRYRQRLSEE